MQFKKITYSEYVERGGIGASEIGVALGLSNEILQGNDTRLAGKESN